MNGKLVSAKSAATSTVLVCMKSSVGKYRYPHPTHAASTNPALRARTVPNGRVPVPNSRIHTTAVTCPLSRNVCNRQVPSCTAGILYSLSVNLPWVAGPLDARAKRSKTGGLLRLDDDLHRIRLRMRCEIDRSHRLLDGEPVRDQLSQIEAAIPITLEHKLRHLVIERDG